MTRHVDLLVAEVQYENSLRLLEPDSIPKLRKPFQRRVPNTALIAQACAAKAAARAGAAQPPVTQPRPKRTRSAKAYARPLNIIEVCEFKAAINAEIERRERLLSRPAPAEGTALCAGSDAGAPFCWNPNCPRCMPA